MNILVIGSEGFIGSHCCDYFIKRGHYVWQADILPLLKKDYTTLQAIHTEVDILFKERTYEVCINASGSANVAYSFENPTGDYDLNVLNVHKLLVAIRQYSPQCKLLNFSSAAIYGNPQTLPVREETLPNPVSPYGFHKLQSEHLLTEYHKFFGLYTCSLRVFSAYGEGLRKQIFWDLYQKALMKSSVELFGTGEETRDFIFIDDLMKALELIILKSPFHGEAINVASGMETKIKDAAGLFYNLFDQEIKFSFSGKAKTGDPNNWKADISQLTKMGFNPQYPIAQGLKKYIIWLKSVEK